MHLYDFRLVPAALVMAIASASGCADDGETNDGGSTSPGSSTGSPGSADDGGPGPGDDGGPVGDGVSSTTVADPESTGGSSSGSVDGSSGSASGSGDGASSTGDASSGSDASSSSGVATDSSGAGSSSTGAASICDPEPGDVDCVTCAKQACCAEIELCAEDPICECAAFCVYNSEESLPDTQPVCLNGCDAGGFPDNYPEAIICASNACPKCPWAL